jgi:hypothetical protein
VFNVLLNRLGSKLLAENVFYGPIRKIMKRKLRSRIGALFKNYDLVSLDAGRTFPIIKKIGTHRRQSRSASLTVTVCKLSTCSWGGWLRTIWETPRIYFKNLNYLKIVEFFKSSRTLKIK